MCKGLKCVNRAFTFLKARKIRLKKLDSKLSKNYRYKSG